MKKQIAAAAVAVAATCAATPEVAKADVTPFIGEVQIYGGNFCPRGWTKANGNLLLISEFTALYSLYGTTFGGDGRTTFGLPDLSARGPIGYGQGPGLSYFPWGAMGGSQYYTLSILELPSHSHTATSTATSSLFGTNTEDDTLDPAGARLGKIPAGAAYYDGTTFDVAAEAGSVTTQVTTQLGYSGNQLSFGQYQPFLAMLYCVAVDGTFPSRP